jgi:hypothetical protein
MVVFVGDMIMKAEGQIDDPAMWIVQDRHYLNQIYARLLYTSDRALRMDLGVFVNYDFKGAELEYVQVAGIVARGSHRRLVNVTLCHPGILDNRRVASGAADASFSGPKLWMYGRKIMYGSI